MLRKIALSVFCVTAMSVPSIAQSRVDGYARKDGTYVAPHYRTNPNDTKSDNYSTQGNVNPYTGQRGTVNPYPDTNRNYQPTPSYPSQQRRY